MDLEDEKPWEGPFLSTIIATLSMSHTTMQHLLSLLVVGRDAILNINWETTW